VCFLCFSLCSSGQALPNPALLPAIPASNTAAMPDGKIRALCAQIALELDWGKADALVVQLKRLLNGEPVVVEDRIPDEAREREEEQAS